MTDKKHCTCCSCKKEQKKKEKEKKSKECAKKEKEQKCQDCSKREKKKVKECTACGEKTKNKKKKEEKNNKKDILKGCRECTKKDGKKDGESKRVKRVDFKDFAADKLLYHSCTNKECKLISWFLVKNALDGRLPACVDHQCADPDCWRLKKPGAPFCVKHSCSIGGCQKRCPKQRLVCGNHSRCMEEGCNELCVLAEGQAERQFCQAHLCSYGLESPYRCALSKEKDKRFCPHHTCGSAGCAGTAIHGPYCNSHLCKAYGDDACQEKAVKEGHCADHARQRICHFRFCGRVGRWMGNTDAGSVYFCPEHAEGRCEGYGQSNTWYCGETIDDQMPYCKTHRCREPGCFKCSDANFKVPWCRDHKCGMEGCEERKTEGGPFCEEHVS